MLIGSNDNGKVPTESFKKLSRNMKSSILENKLMRVIDSRFEEIRKVDNAVKNSETYLRYVRGCNLLSEFVAKKNRGYAHVDSPESVGRFHSASLFIEETDFESNEEIEELCEILKCFDSMSMNYVDGKILITLLIEDVYIDSRRSW